MDELRERVTIIILENRQVIANILTDVLTEAGYQTRSVAELVQIPELLPQLTPAMLLVDMGMVNPEEEPLVQTIDDMARDLNAPVLPFSCVPIPEDPDILVLRAPGDFAAVVGRVEEAWQKQPSLGAALVAQGALRPEELDAAAEIGQVLNRIGRSLALDELLLRLGWVDRQALDAARGQES